MPPQNESRRVFFTHFQKSQKITARKIITEEKLLRRTTGKVIPELNSGQALNLIQNQVDSDFRQNDG